jgi:hypothetical protein
MIPHSVRLVNPIAMDAMVQCMSKKEDFHHILLSMQEDMDWPNRKAWKTWLSIQNHNQPMDSTITRDLTVALQKIKLKKDVNSMKILSEISAVIVRFKQSLSKEKKVGVVQGCAGDDYAQIIVVADGLSLIELQWNATALELCKAMRKAWHIKGHNDDNKEDNDIHNDSVGLEISLGAVKDKQSLVGKQKRSNCGKTGHRSVKRPNKK